MNLWRTSQERIERLLSADHFGGPLSFEGACMENLSPGRTRNLVIYFKNSFKYLLYPYFQFYRLSMNDLKELAQLKRRRARAPEAASESALSAESSEAPAESHRSP